MRTLYRWEKSRLFSKNCLGNIENNLTNTNTEENEASTSNSVLSYSSDSSRSTDDESSQDEFSSSDCEQSADDREKYDDCDENDINIQNDIGNLELDDIMNETNLDDQVNNHNIVESNTENYRNDDNGLIHENNDIVTVQYGRLHKDSLITVDECVFNLLNFYCRHNITKVTLKESLEMQLKLLPEKNIMPKTLFKLFQYAQSIAPRCKVIKNHYCKKCLYTVNLEVHNKKQRMTCTLCQTCKPTDISFFYQFHIHDQIKFLFEKTNITKKLKPFLSHNDGNISDITDGSEYIRVNTRSNRGAHDSTLIMNTDGLSLVKSSKSHCWPVMFTIAELPEKVRESYIIMAGLWYDDQSKPPMNLFLKPICSNLKDCFIDGIDWVDSKTGNTINSKIVALLMIADAPARAQVQNIMNFNGRYGCNMCEIRTVRAKKIVGKKPCRIYPFQIDCRLRTGTRMEVQAQKLLKSSEKNQIRGVKGYSSMSCLPLIDVGTCVLPEYMHSVLLGVIKQFVRLHVDKPGPWSIKNKINEIDNFIMGVRPPDSFSRLPRELSQYNLYKAYEFYNYLFFYSVPLLSNYLPEKYFQHWLLLVKAIHNLVKDTIKISDLEESDKLLKLFVSQIENLYNDRQLTYNVHQLVHLVLCVKRWGPLRGTSAFAFENYNGFIAKCVHGKKHFAQEVVNNVRIAQGVQLLKNRMDENSGNSTKINESTNYQALGKEISNFEFSDKECYIFHSIRFRIKKYGNLLTCKNKYSCLYIGNL